MDPSRSSQSTGTTVNSSTSSTGTPTTGDKLPVAGKNQRGQQVQQKNGKTNIPMPDRTEQSPHHTTTAPFESVAEVKPEKSWLSKWFSGLFSDSKVEATKTCPKLPAKSTSESNQTTGLETRSTHKVETESSGWLDGFPLLPQWLTGSSVSSVESNDIAPELPSFEDSESPLKSSVELTKRSVEEVESSSKGLWETITNIPSWLRGKDVKPAEQVKGVIPLAEREEAYKPSRFTRAVNFLTSAVRMVDSATDGTVSEVTGKFKGITEAALTYYTGKGFSGNVKQFLASKGTRFPSINDDQFQTMLGNIAQLLASNPDELDSKFQTIEIPTIEINQGLVTPLRVKGLKFKARLLPYPKDCTLIQRQKFQRAIEIEDLECTIDLPRADQAPATLNISLPKGSVSIGSNIAATTGITDIGRLLTSGQSESLPFDHTAIQIKADALKVGFRKLNSATPFDPSAPPSLEAPGVLGFNEGAAEFKDVCIATPISLLRKVPDQTTIVQCGGFKLTNQVSREVMVNMRSIDASFLDPQLSGPLKLDIGLDLSKLCCFPGILSKLPKFLVDAQIDCRANIHLHKGELDIQQAKSGFSFTPTGKNWLSKKVADWLTDAMASDQTKVIMGEDGKPKIHLHIPFLEKIRKIPVLGKLIPNEFPLKGLWPSPDSQGKLVVVDLISNVVQGLQMGWFQIPGKAQLVQQDHEQLCTAAAAGNLSVSKALTTIAGDLESSGHPGQALRMWQAIPSSHFAQISEEDTRLSPDVINRMAHRMVEVDPDKAISLYGLALKDTPIGTLPENYDGEAVMNAAQRLDLTKPNELTVALDVFEFLAMAQPQGGAFATLNQLFRNGQYSPERMSALMVKVIHLPPYADNLSLQATLLEEMEPVMGDTIKEALVSIPTHQLSSQNGISAEETAAHFEPLMLKYHQEVQAARMYQNIHNPAKACQILEDSIKRGNEGASSALEERITSELYHGSYGSPRYISGYQLLMSLEGQALPPSLQQTKEHMLKVLWRETRSQPVKWPGLSADETATTPVAQYQNSAARLFSISEQDADSPDILFEALSDIYREMIEAENSTPNPNQSFTQLTQFKQLVNNLMIETRVHMEALKYLKTEQPERRTKGQQKTDP